MTARTVGAFGLLAAAAVSVGLCLRADGLLEADEALHWLYARHAGEHPLNLLHPWARPLYTLLLWPLSFAGFGAAKALSALAAVAAAWGVWKTGEVLGRRYAATAIPLLFLQPFFVQQIYGVWTEIVFAAFVAWWGWALAARRPIAAAVLAALLPLVRPEGAFFALLTGVAGAAGFLRDIEGRTRRTAVFLIAPAGVVLWWAVSALLTGDPGWLIQNWPWALQRSYGEGPAAWLLAVLPSIAPGGLCVAAVIGAFAPGGGRIALVPIASATVLAVHGVLWATGTFGSAGYLRYFVTIAPCLAVLGAGAIETALARRLPRSGPVVSAAVLLVAFGAAYADGGRRAYLSPPDPPLDARIFGALGRSLSAANGSPPVVYAAHPFVYFELAHVPPGRFANLGDLSASVLSQAPLGAWLVVEDRFYERGEGNVPEAELPALGFHRTPPPDLGFVSGSTDARHDPALQSMRWSLWRKGKG